MFREHDCFVLARSLADDHTVPIGTHGVVLIVYHSNPPAYEVEFPDEQGGNRGKSMTYTITEECMASVPTET